LIAGDGTDESGTGFVVGPCAGFTVRAGPGNEDTGVVHDACPEPLVTGLVTGFGADMVVPGFVTGACTGIAVSVRAGSRGVGLLQDA